MRAGAADPAPRTLPRPRGAGEAGPRRQLARAREVPSARRPRPSEASSVEKIEGPRVEVCRCRWVRRA
jgi:hypothetical protein